MSESECESESESGSESHPLAWPLCVFPCCPCFASFSVAILMMTHKMSSCILFLRAGSDPTSLVCLVLFWFCCVLVCFVLFVCLLFVCFGLFLMGLLIGLCIVSSAFEAIDV